jgi:hypothetical protein
LGGVLDGLEQLLALIYGVAGGVHDLEVYIEATGSIFGGCRLFHLKVVVVGYE